LLEIGAALAIFLSPERDALKRRIDARFEAMLAGGALAEADALLRRALDPALPLMRAHGLRHLIAHLKAEISLSEASLLSKRDTWTYARRQFTFARHQLPSFAWVDEVDAESLALA
jgi:tRNA dimethylallyltransferase